MSGDGGGGGVDGSCKINNICKFQLFDFKNC